MYIVKLIGLQKLTLYCVIPPQISLFMAKFILIIRALQDKLSSRSVTMDGYFGAQQSMQGMVGNRLSLNNIYKNLLI